MIRKRQLKCRQTAEHLREKNTSHSLMRGESKAETWHVIYDLLAPWNIWTTFSRDLFTSIFSFLLATAFGCINHPTWAEYIAVHWVDLFCRSCMQTFISQLIALLFCFSPFCHQYRHFTIGLWSFFLRLFSLCRNYRYQVI